jgi:hypothetical protein
MNNFAKNPMQINGPGHPGNYLQPGSPEYSHHFVQLILAEVGLDTPPPSNASVVERERLFHKIFAEHREHQGA